jgi:hypothetical protein
MTTDAAYLYVDLQLRARTYWSTIDDFKNHTKPGDSKITPNNKSFIYYTKIQQFATKLNSKAFIITYP